MWSCDTCGRPNKSNPLLCDTCGAAAPGADADQVAWALQRDLPMESHLRALAFWYRVGAVLMVLAGAALFALVGSLAGAVVTDGTSWRGPGAIVAGAIGYVGFLVVAGAVGSFVLGHFLGRFANGARLAAAILTIVGLAGSALRFVMTAVVYSRLGDPGAYGEYARPSLAGPIAGLVLSVIWMIAIAWTLFSNRAAQVCAPAYRTLVARTAAMKAPMHKSPFFVVPLMATIVVVLLGLTLWMRLHAAAMY